MNIDAVRSEFPIISAGHVYLDSAATSLTPDSVLAEITNYYQTSRANVHRAHHPLAESATAQYENARTTVANWLGTNCDQYVVVFTSGFTASANLAADLVSGFVDGVVVSQESHHSNILPWTRLSSKCPKRLEVLPAAPADNIPELSGRRLVAIQTLGNVLGETWPVARLCQQAQQAGHWVFLDLAQSASRLKHELDLWQPAFAAFSGHKIYGPTGTGALLVRRDVAEQLTGYGNRAPLGGGTVNSVDLDLMPIWADVPAVWEAGTPNLGGVAGLVSAIHWMQALGLDNIHQHDLAITKELTDKLDAVPGVRIIGAGSKLGLVSFNVAGLAAEDIARSLGAQKIAVRGGGLCANPFIKSKGLTAAVRASVAVYTNSHDIDKLITALEKTIHRLQQHAK